MKALLATVAATALMLGAAHAASFTVNFGAGSTSTNDPATGASGTVLFDFMDTADGVLVKLTVTNTTDTTDFGAGADEGTLTGLLLDLADGVSYVDGSAMVGTYLDTFETGESLAPFGTFDLYFGNDGNPEGGNANDALPEGEMDMVSFLLSGIDDADAAYDAYLAAFLSGDARAALRFQQVNAGEGSDKLLNGMVVGVDIITDDLNPVPVPGAALLMGSALAAGAAARRRRRAA